MIWSFTEQDEKLKLNLYFNTKLFVQVAKSDKAALSHSVAWSHTEKPGGTASIPVLQTVIQWDVRVGSSDSLWMCQFVK